MRNAYNQLSSYKTNIINKGDNLTVVYAATAIVKASPSKITLSTGGWKSMTTKKKMNQASHQFNLGYSVFQKAGDWFVEWKGIVRKFNANSVSLAR